MSKNKPIPRLVPEFDPTDVEDLSPCDILLAQVPYISELTGGRVVGRVWISQKFPNGSDRIYIRFGVTLPSDADSVRAPVTLFEIERGPENYPLWVWDEPRVTCVKVKDEATLLAELRDRFRSDKTVSSIRWLVRLSKALDFLDHEYQGSGKP